MALWQIGGQLMGTRDTFHSAQNSGNFGQKPNVMDHFGSVRPEYLGPALKVDHFKAPNHSSWSGRNVLFHLWKLLSSVQFICILLTTTITKCVVAWVWSVRPECTVPLGTWNFQNFTPGFLLNGKRPSLWTRICVDLKGFASLYVLAGKIFWTTWIRNIPLETYVREHLKCQEVTPV